MALLTPEYLQTKKYTAKRDRLTLAHGGAIQPGVWDAGDLKPTWSSGMNISLAAGFGLVPANNSGNLGLYHVQNDAAFTVTIPPAHASLLRLDQVYILIDDSTDGAAGDDNPQALVVQGAAQSGVTLDNRAGAATLPSNALRIADVVVGAGVSALSAAVVRDRRPWARGAFNVLSKSDGALSGLNQTSPTLLWTGFQQRYELSGAPLRVVFQPGYVQYSAGTNPTIEFAVYIDGAAAATSLRAFHQGTTGGSIFTGSPLVFTLAAPPAGTRLIELRYVVAGASASFAVGATATDPAEMVVEEIIRQNTNNT